MIDGLRYTLIDVGVFGSMIILVIFMFLDTMIQEKKKSKKKKKTGSVEERMLSTAVKHPEVCQAAEVRHKKIGTLGLEDRENDWLARQLRAEARSKRTFAE